MTTTTKAEYKAMQDTSGYTFNCFLCGIGGCTEAHADTHPLDGSKIYICNDCREHARKAQAALGSGHHEVDTAPYSMPSASPMAILIVGLGAVTGAAILLYAIFQLF